MFFLLSLNYLFIISYIFSVLSNTHYIIITIQLCISQIYLCSFTYASVFSVYFIHCIYFSVIFNIGISFHLTKSKTHLFCLSDSEIS